MQISNNSPHLLTSLLIGMHCCYIATSINYVMYNIAYPKINRLHDIIGEFDTHPVQACIGQKHIQPAVYSNACK